MRIAVTAPNRRLVGGVEVYFDAITRALARDGHDVACVWEFDSPANREAMHLPEGASAWCAAELGQETVIAALRQWRPDVIYSSGLDSPELEAATLGVAPGVYFAQGYHGTCISGARTFKFPVTRPCRRRFGVACLLHYFPHRCGGLSPLTMMRDFRRQSRRLLVLRTYRAIITTDYAREEYARHGLIVESAFPGLGHVMSAPRADSSAPERAASDAWRLMFLGRMERLKGGRTFLDALPNVVAELARPVRVTFVGDGGDRPHWERRARQLQAANRGIVVEFLGWRPRRDLERLWAECDLLVVPSLWPEPFATVGREAMVHGVPIVAFAVGGNSQWLCDGVNGYLAPGEPPTATGLAQAIVRCLRDPAVYATLRHGSSNMRHRFSLDSHLPVLLDVLRRVAGQASLGSTS